MRFLSSARNSFVRGLAVFIIMPGSTSAASIDYLLQQGEVTLAQGQNGYSNPWALPPKRPSKQDETHWPEHHGHQQPQAFELQTPRSERFVTPEILQSLKQQQTQTQQVMPLQQNENRNYYSNQRPQYGAPSYGMGYSPQGYDVPMASPWAEGLELFQQGQSLPMVPDAAIGGIPPMQTPIFGDDSFDGIYDYGDQHKDNVFNPYTFIPNEDLN